MEFLEVVRSFHVYIKLLRTFLMTFWSCSLVVSDLHSEAKGFGASPAASYVQR